MTTPSTVSNAIDQSARNPRRVKIGNTEVEQHPIADLIEAEKYAKSQAAATANRPGFGIRVQKITPYYQ